ncbi:MAG TPA: histidine phosphatase family protein [Ktedonobacteraceae bacterium]|nr:histidine phosphatase family protein [Ktedonobacteraceae bacterium]
MMGKSRRLWLVRHGLTAWNIQQRFCGQSDIPLSQEGREQARHLAQSLQPATICALYTSDLLRARETAEIIASVRARPLVVQKLVSWRELDFGAWEGLTYAEIAERFPTRLGFFTDAQHDAPPGGESLLQLQQRVLAALARVIDASNALDEGDILIVSHGGPLRVLLSSVLGMPLERQWQLALNPGSLSALDLSPDQDSEHPQGRLALLNASCIDPLRASSPPGHSTGESEA